MNLDCKMLRLLITALLLNNGLCHEHNKKSLRRRERISNRLREAAYDPLRSVNDRLTSSEADELELLEEPPEIISRIAKSVSSQADPIQTIQSGLTDEDNETPSTNQKDTTFDPLHQTKSRTKRDLATHPSSIPYRIFPPHTSSSLLQYFSPKSLRKQCHLVTIQFTWSSPSTSRQTSWMITLGTLDDLESKHPPDYVLDSAWGGEGLIVAHEHMGYRYQDSERHALCLPGKGVYTLTIFDWGGNGISTSNNGAVEGSYALYYTDGRPLVTSQEEFGYMISHEFSLPLPPMETPVPSVSSVPSESLVPTRDCDWIVVEILYDMYPEETTWMVIQGDYSNLDSGNITIIEQSSIIDTSGLGEGFEVTIGGSAGSALTTRVCLPGEGTYSFVIFDSYYNGICCEFGDGSYTITTPSLPGEILGQGGKFTTFDIATFEVPFVRAPSSSPSVSPKPTTSPAPTVNCQYVELEINFDNYSSETSWKIYKGKELVAESPFYADPDYGGGLSIITICLPGKGEYTFTMEDKAGDGMCCLYGNGSYSLTYKGEDNRDGVKIVAGGEFGYEDSTVFTVPYGLTTTTPTMTPPPTIKCYNVEVTLAFDDYPYETIWLIVEGAMSLGDDDSTSLATVVESPQYGLADLNTTKVHVECLPEGSYTFWIVDSDGICCSFGQGEYSVTVENEDGDQVVVLQGGEFLSLESVAFELPYVPGSSPTMPPMSDGQAPTPATQDNTSPFWVDIDLKFDAAPFEISWEVVDEQNNVIEASPYYTMFYKNGSESHRVYLPNAGDYLFTIIDEGDNGLCCNSGNGNYQVTSHDFFGDVVIQQGSDFGSQESVIFSVYGGDDDSASLWPTPYQGWAASNWPTPVPSPPPFLATPAPTVTGCTPVTIKLHFDVFPYDTHWWLVEGDLNTFENKEQIFVGQSPSPSYDLERFANVTHSFCLGEGQYSFMIFDDGGNGMCCEAGDGFFTLTYGEDNEEFAKGGKFGFFDVVVFEVPFPTRSPSWTPPPTTSTPTSEAPTGDNTPAPSIGGSIPDCDFLMDITVDTDGDQNAIRWEVALGDQSSITNTFALIVAQSDGGRYSVSSAGSSERTHQSEFVCLPGEGQYTFTLFNNAGGDTRYRLVVDGSLVAYNLESGPQETTTFSVPVTAQPTPAPQPIDAMECTFIEISITFDDFPDETSWAVYEGDADGAVIVDKSPSYLNQTENTTSHQVCLPGDGEYSFVIYDVANDGMCCNFGEGSYVVSSVNDPVIVIAEGGQFTESDITTFQVPIMIAPSTAPSVTPRPTESAPPTIPCTVIKLTVTFDAYPSETVWTLYDSDNNTIADSPSYPNTDYANRTVKQDICLPDGSYTFLITDQAGDGNCCVGLGDGSYSIVYEGDSSDIIIVDNGPDPTFVYYDKTEFTIPYVIPPSKSPTISPAPTESMAPTAHCVQMEVVINFDAYPSDTLWEITIGKSSSWENSNAVIVADSPIYPSSEAYSTVTHSICLPGDDSYTFTVFDGLGNGMCCDDGTGGFILLMLDEYGNREIIAEGAEFEWRLSVQFDLAELAGPRMDNFVW